jgi:hypothetical protein
MPSTIQALPHWVQLVLLVVPAVSAVLAAGALFLNFYQSRRTNTESRATLVSECLTRFASDEAIQRAFYSVEYGDFLYDDAFHNSEREREIDKLLRHFANLALSWKAGLMSTRDLRPIEYYVLRVMRNTEILKYIKFIDEWSREAGIRQHPYAVLSELSDALSQSPQQRTIPTTSAVQGATGAIVSADTTAGDGGDKPQDGVRRAPISA